MTKIGFVDYFIDEWHSNNYIEWIKELCAQEGYAFEVRYAWAETETYPDKLSTTQWCAQKGIEKCATIEELCAKSDCIMILAPANPEKHLLYAKEVFKCGKPVYVDKTFAPDLEEAKQIFALGEQYGTKFFSTSALRYASELPDTANGLMLQGGGRSFEEYIVHQLEMLVRVMGCGVKRVKVFPGMVQKMCIAEYADGRYASLAYAPSNPFAITVEDEAGASQNMEIVSDFFQAMLRSILDFFADGNLPFAAEQTMKVIQIRDALLKAQESPDLWVNI